MSKRFGRNQKRKLKQQLGDSYRALNSSIIEVRHARERMQEMEDFHENLVEYLQNKLGIGHVLFKPLDHHYDINHVTAIHSPTRAWNPNAMPKVMPIYHLDKIFCSITEDNDFFRRDIHVALRDNSGFYCGHALTRDAIKNIPTDILAKEISRFVAVELQKAKRKLS